MVFNSLVEILSMTKTVAKIILYLGISRVISVKRRHFYSPQYIVPNSLAYEELMQNQKNKNKYSLWTLFPNLSFPSAPCSASELSLSVCPPFFIFAGGPLLTYLLVKQFPGIWIYDWCLLG